MLKPLAYTLIILTSFAFVTGQTPDTKKDAAANMPKPAGATQPMRGMPFPAGVSLQLLIKELASDLELNVLFDLESRIDTRRTTLDLKNVTSAEALNYLLLQEDLIADEVGPRTILVSTHLRGRSVPQVGVGLTPLTEQLSQYFGVDGGTLINHVRADSPAAKAGLKAGDVITEVDDMPIRAGTLFRAVKNKIGTDLTLKIVRDRKAQKVTVTPQNGVE